MFGMDRKMAKVQSGNSERKIKEVSFKETQRRAFVGG
jgi:hypothetical protein